MYVKIIKPLIACTTFIIWILQTDIVLGIPHTTTINYTQLQWEYGLIIHSKN